MFRLASWVAVVCMALSSHVDAVNVFPQTLVNFSILAFSLWVIFDGMVVASDLRTAESEIQNVQAQVRFQNNQLQSQNMIQAETLKNIQDNNLLLLEIRMRLIMINQKLKRQLAESPDGSVHSGSFSSSQEFETTRRKCIKRSNSII